MAETTVNTKFNYLKEQKVTARLAFTSMGMNTLLCSLAESAIPLYQNSLPS